MLQIMIAVPWLEVLVVDAFLVVRCSDATTRMAQPWQQHTRQDASSHTHTWMDCENCETARLQHPTRSSVGD